MLIYGKTQKSRYVLLQIKKNNFENFSMILGSWSNTISSEFEAEFTRSSQQATTKIFYTPILYFCWSNNTEMLTRL